MLKTKLVEKLIQKSPKHVHQSGDDNSQQHPAQEIDYRTGRPQLKGEERTRIRQQPGVRQGEAAVAVSVFGDEKIIATRKMEALADVFEGVAIGPADADGFFGEGHDLFALAVEVVLAFNPGDLVGHEVFGEESGAVERYTR